MAHDMTHVPDWMHKRMCQEGTFLWPDEDVGSSGGVYVIAWLIRDDRLLISIRNSFFSRSPFG